MSQTKEKIHVLTLGCSKNSVDSEVLMHQLEANKRELVSEASDADVAVINTCGFIEEAKNESIRTILEAVELKRQGKLKKVVVMGCLSERYGKELRAEIPGIDEIIGANKMDQVVVALGGDYKNELVGERLLTTPSHYAYLKISEGCDNPCSFCSIPIMRGLHKSKPMDRILLEARRLAALGVKEVILIAQDSTYYGLDINGQRLLPELLERLSEIDGVEWIRLMYAYPAKFPREILKVFKSNPKICKYLDIPVQHAAEEVLKSMRRGITARALRELLHDIRSEVPGIALRTTLIVGYPNEGDREFEDLMSFVDEIKFERLGVFTYSQEDDTTAFPLGDPVPQEMKELRKAKIMEMQGAISRIHNEDAVGSIRKILVDRIDDTSAIGRSQFDAPEIDNEIIVHEAADFKVGEFREVEIVDAEDHDLFAIPYSSERVTQAAG
jgi:ribosomal protein S12 methylthiotransferase